MWQMKSVKKGTVYRGSVDRVLESERTVRYQGADDSE